jgi:hypothetical protein
MTLVSLAVDLMSLDLCECASINDESLEPVLDFTSLATLRLVECHELTSGLVGLRSAMIIT